MSLGHFVKLMPSHQQPHSDSIDVLHDISTLSRIGFTLMDVINDEI